MTSGIKSTDECQRAFAELKMRKKHSYIIYRIDKDKNQIVVDACGDPGLCYLDQGGFFEYVQEHKDDGPFFAVLDFKSSAEEIGTVLFVSYVLDTAKVRDKMLYASSQENFKKTLEGIGSCHSISDVSDIECEAVKESIKKRTN